MARRKKYKDITFKGSIDKESLDGYLKGIENIIDEGKKDISLDFNGVSGVKADAMLRLCSFIMHAKDSLNVAFRLNMSSNIEIRKEMINNNWASLIDEEYPVSSFRGFLYTPTIIFTNEEEHQETVDRILEVIIEAYPDLERTSFATIEWCLCEIMDNVIVHSRSKIGGLVQMKIHRNITKDIEMIVSDAGIGIPKSLKEIYPNEDEVNILMESINQGITNGEGQGNGLFGTTEICRKTNGEFVIHSGKTRLTLIKDGKEAKPLNRNFTGTTISAKIRTSDSEVLHKALQFDGKVYEPTDYIELKYESNLAGNTHKYCINPRVDSVGTRLYGRTLRNKLLNIYDMSQDVEIIEIDFKLVNMVSSSFADELISKTIEIRGVEFFNKHMRVVACNDKIKGIISNVIIQRNNISITFG